jgi:hypothetical protein
MMIKREKTLTISLPPQTTFGVCIKTLEQFKLRNWWGVKQFFRILSADPQTGKITGRLAGTWRIDLHIQGDSTQSSLTVTLIHRLQSGDMIGFVPRYIDQFFEAVLQNSTPLIGNPQAIQTLTDQEQGTVRKYAAQPVRYQINETNTGTAIQWARVAIGIFIILGIIGAFLAAIQGIGH